MVHGCRLCDTGTMATHTLTIQVTEYTARKLREAAKAAGVTPERMAEMVLESALFDHNDFGWANGDPAAPLHPLDVREPTHAWEGVKAEIVDKSTGGDALPAALQTTPEDYDGPHVELDEALDDFKAELERRLASRAG